MPYLQILRSIYAYYYYYYGLATYLLYEPSVMLLRHWWCEEILCTYLEWRALAAIDSPAETYFVLIFGVFH
jgi:hypothetical protein